MSYARLAFATILGVLVLSAPSTAVAEIPPASAAMIGKVNELRHSKGLATLEASDALMGSARDYARYMLRRDYFGHLASIQAGGNFLTLGETLAMHSGWRPRVAATFSRWMASPPHRAVLLSPAFRRIGVSKARGRFGRRAATTWVAQLGGQRVQPPLALPAGY